MSIYAKRGERVTCVQGHHICTMARDVEVGELFQRSALTDWQQPEPAIGTLAKDCLCNRCGSLWFGGPDGNRLAAVLHFADGWRELE